MSACSDLTFFDSSCRFKVPSQPPGAVCHITAVRLPRQHSLKVSVLFKHTHSHQLCFKHSVLCSWCRKPNKKHEQQEDRPELHHFLRDGVLSRDESGRCSSAGADGVEGFGPGGLETDLRTPACCCSDGLFVCFYEVTFVWEHESLWGKSTRKLPGKPFLMPSCVQYRCSVCFSLLRLSETTLNTWSNEEKDDWKKSCSCFHYGRKIKILFLKVKVTNIPE